MRCDFKLLSTNENGTLRIQCSYCSRIVDKSPTLDLKALCPARKEIRVAECSNLGLKAGTIKCDLCGMRDTFIDLFKCTVHGECTQQSSGTGTKCCLTCRDFRPKLKMKTVVISVASSPRRKQFISDWKNWDFEWFDAFDGANLRPGWNWEAPIRSWACYRSHLAVIERFLASGDEQIFILEDDAIPLSPLYKELIASYLDDAPEGWGMLYFGGQLLFATGNNSEIINDSWHRAYNVNRLHAYMLRRDTAHSIYEWLLDPKNFKRKMQVDHCLGEWQKTRKDIYVPDKWIIGQRDGLSEITLRQKRGNNWKNSSDFTLYKG